jgi:hypothetical protein
MGFPLACVFAGAYLQGQAPQTPKDSRRSRRIERFDIEKLKPL